MKQLLKVVGVVLVFSLASCVEKTDSGTVLGKEKMQAVFWDVLQAEAFTQNFVKKDSTKDEKIENASLQRKIFELHKISREDFTASYEYYNARPELMKIMLDSMSAKAERERNKLMTERYGGAAAQPQ